MDVCGETRPQGVVTRAWFRYTYAHRNALDDFGEISCSVVGWKQREFRSRRAADALDLPFTNAAAVGVDFELDRLAGTNFGELSLLEVLRDPDACVGNNAQKGLSRRDQLSDLNLLSRDFPGCRCGDAGVIELQLRVCRGSTGGESASVGHTHAGFSRVHGSAGGCSLTLGGEKVRVRDVRSCNRRVELLLRDDLLGRELPRSGEISVSFVGVGARSTDLRVESSALAGGTLNLRLCLSSESAAASCCLGSHEICLRLLHPHAIIGVVELDEELACVNVIVLAHVHGLHVAADFRQHGNDVTVDLGVVGRLVGATVAPLLECPDHENQSDDTNYGKNKLPSR